MRKLIQTALFYLCICCLLSCNATAQAGGKTSLDYDISENWISLPENISAHDVDLFYVYPTVYLSSTPGHMDITDKALSKAAQGVCVEQTGVFKTSANVFAPFYRQMSIAVLSLPESEFNQYFSSAYMDVKSAFLYYLKHQNNNRPFILAGHSQGSVMILQLMKDLFKASSLMDRLIAAYIIGYSVTQDELTNHPWLKIARTASDTGVIITYNTQSKNATGSPVLLPGAQCVNPLTWSVDETPGAATLNKGAVFFDENHKIAKEIPAYTSAYIGDNGALIAPNPVPEDFHKPESLFPIGVYHAYDYNFFYRNLEANVARRVQAFRADHDF